MLFQHFSNCKNSPPLNSKITIRRHAIMKLQLKYYCSTSIKILNANIFKSFSIDNHTESRSEICQIKMSLSWKAYITPKKILDSINITQKHKPWCDWSR